MTPAQQAEEIVKKWMFNKKFSDGITISRSDLIWHVTQTLTNLQTQHEAEIYELNKAVLLTSKPFIPDNRDYNQGVADVLANFDETRKEQIKENDMYDGDTFDISDVILEHQNVGRWKGEMEAERKLKNV